jgi:vitamin B12 transporter
VRSLFSSLLPRSLGLAFLFVACAFARAPAVRAELPDAALPEPSKAPAAPALAPQSPASVDAGALSGDAADRAESTAAPATDVVVYGSTRAKAAEESARSVKVIELEAARRTSLDLGQVLSQSEGISVRRSGALGSPARVSLAGLIDEQIPIFVDGVPIEVAGYPFGIVNVPVSLLERAEVHRGVVPIRLGADALGGAIDLITDDSTRGSKGLFSLQGGSYDTMRAAATLRYHEPRTGIYARADGFFDHARNDYPIQVDVLRPDGSTRPATVHKLNDRYQAGMGSAELGVVNRPWARRLVLRVSYAALKKGIPHNQRMRVPYGEVRARRSSTTSTLRFESVKWHAASLGALVAYARRRVSLLDQALCKYDWYGNCIEIPPPGGEREQRPYDQHIEQHNVYGRLTASYAGGRYAHFSLTSALTAVLRNGRDYELEAEADALRGRRDAYALVSGVEHRLDAFSARLQNIVSLKHYAQFARAEQLTQANGFVPLSRDTQRVGVGDGLRFRFTEQLYAKTAYEWATRLPSPDQMFGDGELVEANLTLQPEQSHNVNLSLALDVRDERLGEFRAFVGGFLRFSEDMIYPLVGTDRTVFQNLTDARTLGCEANANWTSKGRYLALTANATYQDARNAATSGPYARYHGDRIPNRPYLFANASAVATAPGLFGGDDELSLYYQASYVHPFSIGWDLGGDDSALTVPAQLVHSLGAGVLLRGLGRTVSATIDINNLTDARLYDVLGVQRPGRTVFAKLTLEV